MANTWIQFKTNVLARMTDIIPTDDLMTMACALYCKAYLSREVDHDILMAKSYQDQYMDIRRRLLGYQTALVPGSTLDPIVRTYLPVDTTRQGIQPLLTQLIKNAYQDVTGLYVFLDKAFREAAVDIQTFIPCYRITQTTCYTNSDVTQVGGLARGEVPMGAQLYEAYYLEAIPVLAENVLYQIGQLVTSNGRTYTVLQSGLIGTGLLGPGLQTTDGSVEALGGMTFAFRFYETQLRSWMKQYDWHQRYEFDRLKTGCSSRRMPAAIMIDEDTFSFYAWPFLDSSGTFTYQITWTNPTVFTFGNTDLVPFDDEVESAVAEYVWAKFYESVEKDRMQAQLHATAYNVLRSKLVAECAAKGRIKYTR